jgi:hypothetical protein
LPPTKGLLNLWRASETIIIWFQSFVKPPYLEL